MYLSTVKTQLIHFNEVDNKVHSRMHCTVLMSVKLYRSDYQTTLQQVG